MSEKTKKLLILNRCVHRFECVTGGQQKARITSVGWNLNGF